MKEKKTREEHGARRWTRGTGKGRCKLVAKVFLASAKGTETEAFTDHVDSSEVG